MGPTTSAWSPPDNGPEIRLDDLSGAFSLILRVRLRSLSFSLSLYYVYVDGSCQVQAGQASGPKPLG